MMHKRKMYVSPTTKVVELRTGYHLLTISGTRDSYSSGGDAWSGTGTGALRSSYGSGEDAWSGTGTGASRSSYSSGGDAWE